ncbi:NGG1p interacting factor NIF3 [Patescibacteria group bacterium]|nr:NGG1p interacting factor NIF3 [Patescibacteria group bacterium]MBU1123066.1 NGG1p interacting factor NIF3 [Patescibacteria group bacterium]
MKLSKLFTRLIEHGITADPRSKKEIEKLLKKQKDKQKKLSKKEQELFDEERLWNPYSDTRICYGTGDEEIKSIIVGIDVETPEFLLVDRLKKNGTKIDAVMAHHPSGRGLADLDKVMAMQIDLLAQHGIPENRGDTLMGPRMEKIWRSIHSNNMFRAQRAAQLLDIPFFSCHTPADNHVYQFVEKKICAKKYDDLGEILNALLDIPEYKSYAKLGNPPIIANGSKSGRPGKVVATEFTGGTNGPEEYIEEQARAGVGTIITMHVTDKSLEKAKEHHVNFIQCSHIASDNIGLNLILDKIEKEEKGLKVLEFSGFERVKRK